MKLTPISPENVRRLVAGGPEAMGALRDRIASGDGPLSMELYQLNDRSIVASILERGVRGVPVDLLGDARLSGGGYADELATAVALGGGRHRTYGGDGRLWQHAKTYHVQGREGPETWVSNLAPIPDSMRRTELAFVVTGDAAAAARLVTDETIGGDHWRIQAAIDAAAGQGILVNDPLAARRRLTEGFVEVLDRSGGELLVVTKGIESASMTDALIGASRRGPMTVLVRDIAREDATRLDAAGVPTWIVGGGAKPRVNGIFASDRAIVGSAFLWDNMVGAAGVHSSRDIGVLLSGELARQARTATLEPIRDMPRRVSLQEALRTGLLPEHI